MNDVSVTILPPFQSVAPEGEIWSIWESAIHLVGESKYGWLVTCIALTVLSGGLFVIGDLIGKGVRCITPTNKNSEEKQKQDHPEKKMLSVAKGADVVNADGTVEVVAHVVVDDASDKESVSGDDEDGALNGETGNNADEDDASLPVDLTVEHEAAAAVVVDNSRADGHDEEGESSRSEVVADDVVGGPVDVVEEDLETEQEMSPKLDELSAKIVQAHFRGFLARVDFKKKQAERKEKLDAAAGLVQKLAKSVEAKVELEDLKKARVDKALEQACTAREEATIKLQAFIRMKKAKTEFEAKQYIASRFGKNFRRFKIAQKFRALVTEVKIAANIEAEKQLKAKEVEKTARLAALEEANRVAAEVTVQQPTAAPIVDETTLQMQAGLQALMDEMKAARVDLQRQQDELKAERQERLDAEDKKVADAARLEKEASDKVTAEVKRVEAEEAAEAERVAQAEQDAQKLATEEAVEAKRIADEAAAAAVKVAEAKRVELAANTAAATTISSFYKQNKLRRYIGTIQAGTHKVIAALKQEKADAEKAVAEAKKVADEQTRVAEQKARVESEVEKAEKALVDLEARIKRTYSESADPLKAYGLDQMLASIGKSASEQSASRLQIETLRRREVAHIKPIAPIRKTHTVVKKDDAVSRVVRRATPVVSNRVRHAERRDRYTESTNPAAAQRLDDMLRSLQVN